MSVCIFANMKISNSVRLNILKKSFLSLSNVNVQKWYINIRGPQKKQAEIFLRSQLGTRLILFDLNSGNWHVDSRKMFSHINQKTIFYWIEDHILMVKPEILDRINEDFLKNSCDHLLYSFWGFNSHFNEFSDINDRVSCEYFDIIDYGTKENKIRQNRARQIYGRKAYLVSVCSLFSYSFFRSNLFNKRLFPLRRWPKETPFDFERSPEDLWILPFKVGVPKLEISCSVDDDGAIKGSSLASRGLVKLEISRDTLLNLEGRGVSKSALKNNLKMIPGFNFVAKPIIRFIKQLTFYF